MTEFTSLTKEQRDEVFFETARRTGLYQAVVEKDFWVCWVLDFLFGQSQFCNSFAFKGGTSLSKGFNLIGRMSEDIDLILDWRILGYGINEPWEPRSNTKQLKFIEGANGRASNFLSDKLLTEMQATFKTDDDERFVVYLDNMDPLTLCIDYPKLYSDSSVLQVIRLESGSLAAWSPTVVTHAMPFIADSVPQYFKQPGIPIRTVAPERTFWEKVTILHKEAHRTNGRMPPRYSRHYYDVYMISKTSVKDSALRDIRLLKKVVDFNDKFYRAPVARLDLAKPGTISLLPPTGNLPQLMDDYSKMQGMLFGEVPSFDRIMASIAKLQDEINALGQ